MADWFTEFRAQVMAQAAGVPVFTRVRPQGSTGPAIVLNIVSAPRTYHAAGVNELTFARVQVDCFSDKDVGAARAVAMGLVAGIPVAWVGATQRFDKVETDEPVTDGDQTATGYVHRARFDARVWHAPLAG